MSRLEKTIAFLRNGVFNVDIFGIERNGGKIIAPLGSQPFEIAAGDVLTVSVVIQNKGIGHSFVPEQRDFYESWVEFEVKDAAGRTLMHSGALQPDGALDPGAHSFTNRLINKNGGLNDLHQVWDTRVVAYNNTIQSGRSQIVRYEFKVPADAVGPITITAKVNYRHFNQHFIDYGMGKHYERCRWPRWLRARARWRWARIRQLRPIHRITRSGCAGITTASDCWTRSSMPPARKPSSASPSCVRIMPTPTPTLPSPTFNGSATTTRAASLEKALQLAPHNARALYYLALVERTQGHLDAAISDLREVTAQFPRSRDAHRELGFSLYQQHKYDEARTEYETLQSIDPDDLAAHYILSIVYRRLGMKEQAARESAAFADQKDDPTASTYALEFLRKHPEITSESVPWHTHSDLTAQPAAGGGAGAQ